MAHPQAIQPRNPPKSTRAEYLELLHAIADRNDFMPFMELVEKVADGERDAVAVLTAADLPLIRKARRAMAATGNPHIMEDYPYFTAIIRTIQRQPPGGAE